MRRILSLHQFIAICACISAGVSVVRAQSKGPESDITLPTAPVILGGVNANGFNDAYIDDRSVVVAAGKYISQSVPQDIDLKGIRKRKSPVPMANRHAVAPPYYQDRQLEVLSDNVSTASDGVNHNLDIIRRRRAGLDVFDDLIVCTRRALRASLALAEYLDAHPSADSTTLADLTDVVAQLEESLKYTKQVTHILTRA